MPEGRDGMEIRGCGNCYEDAEISTRMLLRCETAVSARNCLEGVVLSWRRSFVMEAQNCDGDPESRCSFEIAMEIRSCDGNSKLRWRFGIAMEMRNCDGNSE